MMKTIKLNDPLRYVPNRPGIFSIASEEKWRRTFQFGHGLVEAEWKYEDLWNVLAT
jgi:hypothetical protein